MKPQLTPHEKKIIQRIGIYKGQILESLIIQYKKQKINYNLKQLTQFSRKNLTILKQQTKLQEVNS